MKDTMSTSKLTHKAEGQVGGSCSSRPPWEIHILQKTS